MNIYFSGIGGVGIGPLAEIANDAGHSVAGSDMRESLVTQQLATKGIAAFFNQDGTALEAQHQKNPIDWFVYTSALPSDHPELLKAKALGIRTGKRDEFLAEFIKEHQLTMIAIAGTHGKTSTTGMAVWSLKQLGIPVSYSVGSTMSFGPSGAYDPKSTYFIYECDEFDRNFLHFNPEFSLITSIDYDHPDTYPTEETYKEAFRQYISQSGSTIAWEDDLSYVNAPLAPTITRLDNQAVVTQADLPLAGAHNRRNATLVATLLEKLSLCTFKDSLGVLSTFPGTDRRFEKIDTLLYSDYGHHPNEIKATLQLAKEISPHVTLVYQPHQNVRQHEVIDLYRDDIFKGADTIYWLPTHQTREREDLSILSPADLTQQIHRNESLHIAELNESLEAAITAARANNSLVLCMGAGSIDQWVRAYAAKHPF